MKSNSFKLLNCQSLIAIQSKRSTTGSRQHGKNYYSGQQSSPASNQLRQDEESGYEGYEIPSPRYYYPAYVKRHTTERHARDSENNEHEDNTHEQQRTHYSINERADEEPIYDYAAESERSSHRTASYVEVVSDMVGQLYNNMTVSPYFPNSSYFPKVVFSVKLEK